MDLEYFKLILQLFISSFLAGYFIACVLAGVTEGHKIERSTRFLIGGYYIHLHHWFIFLVIGLLLYIFKLGGIMVYGATLGIVIQGLTYRDWWLFIYKKEDFHKIYSKWWNSLTQRTLIGFHVKAKKHKINLR